MAVGGWWWLIMAGGGGDGLLFTRQDDFVVGIFLTNLLDVFLSNQFFCLIILIQSKSLFF